MRKDENTSPCRATDFRRRIGHTNYNVKIIFKETGETMGDKIVRLIRNHEDLSQAPAAAPPLTDPEPEVLCLIEFPDGMYCDILIPSQMSCRSERSA